MRILMLHNYYQQRGGEDSVVLAERDLLKSRGHEVRLLTVLNEDIRGKSAVFKTAWQAHYSKSSRQLVTEELERFVPDIVHVHNFFPLLTPSIFDACRSIGVPVVQTLHNFRTICPGALLMRDGHVCEKCVNGTPFHAIRYRCYRGSFVGSLVVARMASWHRRRGTWLNKVDRFITLTEFARSKFIQAGFPADKLLVKPNFVQRRSGQVHTVERSGILYVGRLSEEKGIRVLLEAWQNLNVPLRIVGDGPLSDLVKNCQLPHVSYLGPKSSDEVFQEMSHAMCLVVPSICYEGFPLVIAEAYAAGLPVIASRIGGLPEIVCEGRTGLLFSVNDVGDLAQKVVSATSGQADMLQMGKQAFIEYNTKYSPDLNYKMLMNVYHSVALN